MTLKSKDGVGDNFNDAVSFASSFSARVLMSLDEKILRGSEMGPVPGCSLAQHLCPKIKALPQDQVFQVDAETGATQTVRQNLSNSIRLSEGLRKLGLRENEVVAMACRNSFAADEIVLATWLSGATIGPVSTHLKTAELKHVLDLFEPKFFFIEEEFVPQLTSVLANLSAPPAVILTEKGKTLPSSYLCLEDVRLDVDVDNYRPLPVTSPSTQLVALLGSSGTTGLPKAVGITHTNLVFQEMNLARTTSFGHTIPCLQISAFFWVTGVLMYVRCLASGMKRILVRESTSKSVLRAIEEHKPGWTLVAPVFLSSITNDPDFEKRDVSSMKKFAVGGSPFSRNIGEKLMAIWGREKFVNTYGTTEATGCVLSSENADDVFALGKPTPGVEVKVMDLATGQSLGAKAPGELCVRSPGIMWGYVKNEEVTKAAIDAHGWLHTGDLCYYDDSHQVYLVDRIKEMIKIMNMQISPEEVENTIASLPGVLEAGVAGVTHDGDNYKLKALVVKEKNSPVTEADVYARVADTLSDYKRLTGGVDFVDSLPKTSSGKLHRRELKKMAQTLFTG